MSILEEAVALPTHLLTGLGVPLLLIKEDIPGIVTEILIIPIINKN